MARGYLDILIICLSLSYGVASIELLANYKYWKSVSDQLTYDYSGNSRHGIVSLDYIVTDRGLSPNDYYFPSFMNYNNPELVNYTFSFWLFNTSSGSFWISLWADSGEVFAFYYKLNTNYIEIIIEIYLKPETRKTSTIDMFLGWNLHTMSVNSDSSNTNRINIHLYKNLEHLHSNFIDTQLQFTKMNSCHLGNREDSAALGPILYELWIHTGFSNISELSTLLSIYNCPASPTTVCLPNHPPTMNKVGQLCPSECTSNNQSCDIGLNCITNNKSGCQYGLYDLETSQCLFYCPNYSCSCPARITNRSQTYTAFSCSCITGYAKLSDNPPACMSDRCLSYNKVGYEYICITTESGYALDASGDCCVCKSEFTQVSTNPLICVNTSVCINYITSGGDYTCSSCAEGFVIDPEGKCNKCNSNYVNVLANPFTCALKIENCSNYIYDGFNWICDICNEGYSVDENFMCNQCQSGYYLLLTSPFTCILEVDHCVSYKKEGEEWKCKECTQGYQLDISGYCMSDRCLSYNKVGYEYICITTESGYTLDASGNCCVCTLEFTKVSTTPLICVNTSVCINYTISGEDYTCSSCAEGFLIDSEGKCNKCNSDYVNVLASPFTCALKIDNCSSYIYDGLNWICDICNEGYSVDENFMCNQCQSGYYLYLTSPFTCILEVDHCVSYKKEGEEWKCKECTQGYQLDISGYCDECNLGYVRIEIENNICMREIPFCKNHVIKQDQYLCSECQDGYELNRYKRCSKIKCDKGYYLNTDNNCIECSDHCIECRLEDTGKIICLECENGFNLVGAICEAEYLLEQAVQITEVVLLASVSVSIVSLNLNNILSILGTIQIVSYILLYNTNIPTRIKTLLEGITVYEILPNIFEYFVSYQDKIKSDRYKRVDIYNELIYINAGKLLTMLILIILAIVILKLISHFTKKLSNRSILKNIISRLLIFLEWNFFIGYYIQGTLDLTIFSLINLYHVSLSSIYSIVGLSLSVVILVNDI